MQGGNACTKRPIEAQSADEQVESAYYTARQPLGLTWLRTQTTSQAVDGSLKGCQEISRLILAPGPKHGDHSGN